MSKGEIISQLSCSNAKIITDKQVITTFHHIIRAKIFQFNVFFSLVSGIAMIICASSSDIISIPESIQLLFLMINYHVKIKYDWFWVINTIMISTLSDIVCSGVHLRFRC